MGKGNASNEYVIRLSKRRIPGRDDKPLVTVSYMAEKELTAQDVLGQLRIAMKMITSRQKK